MSELNKAQRLYMQSHINVCIARDPAGLSDEELVGYLGMLPTPGVSFSVWSERTGFGAEEKPKKFSELTDEEIGKINDEALKRMRLMEIEKNGNAK